MKEHAVVIAGGGPTGLMLAGELALAGVDVASSSGAPIRSSSARARAGCTRAPSKCSTSAASPSDSSRRDRSAQVTGFGGTRLDISDFPTRHTYGLALRQKHIERILADWVAELRGADPHGREITGFVQDEAGVDVALADGESLRAQYLVGCDGGRSVIRKAAGIDFPGWDPTTSNILARSGDDREAADWACIVAARHICLRQAGVRDRRGQDHLQGRGPHSCHGAPNRATRPPSPRCDDSEGAHRRVRHRLRRPQPDLDLPIHGHDAAGGRISQRTRAARRRRRARALADRRAGPRHRRAGCGEPRLEAGAGGQGHVTGRACSTPITPSVTQSARACCETTMAQVALHRERRSHAGRCATSWANCSRWTSRANASPADDVRPRTFATISGEGHPLLGRRMPDLDIVTAGRPAARLQFPARGSAGAAQPRRARRHRHRAVGRPRSARRRRNTTARGSFRCSARSLRPSAVLIRPDGYVAWVGDGTAQGLTDALTTWFGPP